MVKVQVPAPGKLPIQIRETSSGVITLTGCTEVNVCTLQEMASCLEQGSLSRATGSTNMNNQSRLDFVITSCRIKIEHIVCNFDINDIY